MGEYPVFDVRSLQFLSLTTQKTVQIFSRKSFLDSFMKDFIPSNMIVPRNTFVQHFIDENPTLCIARRKRLRRKMIHREMSIFLVYVFFGKVNSYVRIIYL